jgi:hypothetical protein
MHYTLALAQQVSPASPHMRHPPLCPLCRPTVMRHAVMFRPRPQQNDLRAVGLGFLGAWAGAGAGELRFHVAIALAAFKFWAFLCLRSLRRQVCDGR